MALNGLDARSYKNSTLLFNLARVFIARSPVRGVINPPWIGIADRSGAGADPPSLRLLRRVLHRSACELHRERARLADDVAGFAPGPIADMVDFCPTTSAESAVA